MCALNGTRAGSVRSASVDVELDPTVKADISGSDGEVENVGYEAGIKVQVNVDWETKIANFFKGVFGGEKT